MIIPADWWNYGIISYCSCTRAKSPYLQMQEFLTLS